MNRRRLLAALLPVAVCGVQWLLWDYLRPFVWFLFFPAAYLSAWIGGLWGGLAGTAVSALLVWYVFMPAPFSFALRSAASGFSIGGFVVTGSLFAFLFERLRREQARSDTRFEATFEQAAVGVGIVAIGGRFQRVNRKLCEMLGYSKDELLALTVASVTHPDDREASAANVRSLLEGGRASFSVDKRHLRRDGTPVWSTACVSLVRDADGEPAYFVAVVEDLQARQEAEAALRESEIEYRVLFDNMLNGYAHCRMLFGDDGEPEDFVYLDVNKAFEARTGLRDVVGRRVTEVIPGIRETDAELLRTYGRVARGGPPERFETYLEALRMWFSISVHCPRPEHFVAVFDVVTERKQAEDALRASEKRYRELVESANSVILHWSRDGTVTFINEYAQKLFGWSADEILGRPVTVLLPETESTGADLRGLTDEIAAHPERYLHNVNENVCRDGQRIWMSWTNRAFRDDQGRVTGLLAVGNDVTAQKHTEEELKRRNRDLERFDRAAVGRELAMIELKRQVNALSAELGRAPPFDLAFADDGVQPEAGPRR